MKKTYKNPTLLVVNVRNIGMLCVSGNDVYDTAANSNKAVLSRGARFSDDDWEDEEL